MILRQLWSAAEGNAIAAEVIFYDGVTVKEGFSRLPMRVSSGRMEDRSTDLMQSA